jgi:hypothetical protein
MQQTRYKLPAYRPKPSGSILMHWEHAIKSDNDLWVEHYYKNKHGQDIYYYCSVLTSKCQLFQPPTGFATIVYQEGIAADPTLHCRVPGPLPKEESSRQAVERTRSELYLLRSFLRGQRNERIVSNETSI